MQIPFKLIATLFASDASPETAQDLEGEIQLDSAFRILMDDAAAQGDSDQPNSGAPPETPPAVLVQVNAAEVPPARDISPEQPTKDISPAQPTDAAVTTESSAPADERPAKAVAAAATAAHLIQPQRRDERPVRDSSDVLRASRAARPAVPFPTDLMQPGPPEQQVPPTAGHRIPEAPVTNASGDAMKTLRTPAEMPVIQAVALAPGPAPVAKTAETPQDTLPKTAVLTERFAPIAPGQNAPQATAVPDKARPEPERRAQTSARPQTASTVAPVPQPAPLNAQELDAGIDRPLQSIAAAPPEPTAAAPRLAGYEMLQTPNASSAPQPAQSPLPAAPMPAGKPETHEKPAVIQGAAPPAKLAPAAMPTAAAPPPAADPPQQAPLSPQGPERQLATSEPVLPPPAMFMDDRPVQPTAAADSANRILLTPTTTATALRDVAALVTQSDDGQVDITLKPEELGRLRISLTPTDTGITVLIQPERPETVELMRRHLDQLSQEFRDLGYRDVSFAFEQQQKDGSQDQTDSRKNPQAEPEGVQHLPDQSVEYRNAYGVTQAGLNIRL